MVLSSRSFPQTFSPDRLEKKFALFRTFCREGKSWKSLGAKSSEYGIGIEQTHLNSILFPA